MTIKTLAKFTCDRCNAVAEYESAEEATRYTHGITFSGAELPPYIPKEFVSVCHSCAIDMVHKWWRSLSQADTEKA